MIPHMIVAAETIARGVSDLSLPKYRAAKTEGIAAMPYVIMTAENIFRKNFRLLVSFMLCQVSRNNV
jgi:hypothetical protein